MILVRAVSVEYMGQQPDCRGSREELERKSRKHEWAAGQKRNREVVGGDDDSRVGFLRIGVCLKVDGKEPEERDKLIM